MDPGGEVFSQARAADLANRGHLVFVCPRYEGVDERIRSFVDMELSIGDYVVTGGELPALVVIDAVMRLLPGAIDELSTAEESFSAGLLEYPQYTRPPTYRGIDVPEILDVGRPRSGCGLAAGAGPGADPQTPTRSARGGVAPARRHHAGRRRAADPVLYSAVGRPPRGPSSIVRPAARCALPTQSRNAA